jgi:tetratricopeptide (TPR) repeat protein
MQETLNLEQPLERPSVERITGLWHRSRWGDIARMSLLFLLAVLPYLNALRNGFVYDDGMQVLSNPYIRDFSHLREIFTTTVNSYKSVGAAANYYRPLMNFGYLLCFQLFGPSAYAFHLVNVLLHGLVVVLLFLVTKRMFRNSTLSFVAAALFALHPIHTESVDWVAAVTDVELTFFCLLTFWFFLGLGGLRSFRHGLTQFGMAVSFVLAALSKEPALTLPLLATVYEHAYREDRDGTTRAQKVLRYGALWLLTVAYLVVRVRFLGTLAHTREHLAGYEVFFSGFTLFGQYVGKLIWPVRLCAYYVFEASDPTDPRVLGGLAALVLIAILFVALWKLDRTASFGVIWLMVTLTPVLNATWMASNVFTERYLYLPSVGFCWVIAWGWTRLFAWSAQYRLPWRWVFAGTLGVIASWCIVHIVTRNRVWRDNLTLYQRTVAESPKAYYMHFNLGDVYWDKGDAKSAEREWTEALMLAPNADMVLDNLVMLNLSQQHYEEALGYSLRALALEPNDPEKHVNAAAAFLAMGNTQEAERQLQTAVTLAPLNVRARLGLGELYLNQAQLSEAEEQFRRSLKAQPTPRGYVGLGMVRWRRGDRQEAERLFKEAESLDRSSAGPHFMLGLLYLDLGRNMEGERELRKGLESEPTNQGALAALQKLRGTSNP